MIARSAVFSWGMRATRRWSPFLSPAQTWCVLFSLQFTSPAPRWVVWNNGLCMFTSSWNSCRHWRAAYLAFPFHASGTPRGSQTSYSAWSLAWPALPPSSAADCLLLAHESFQGAPDFGWQRVLLAFWCFYLAQVVIESAQDKAKSPYSPFPSPWSPAPSQAHHRTL